MAIPRTSRMLFFAEVRTFGGKDSQRSPDTKNASSPVIVAIVEHLLIHGSALGSQILLLSYLCLRKTVSLENLFLPPFHLGMFSQLHYRELLAPCLCTQNRAGAKEGSRTGLVLVYDSLSLWRGQKLNPKKCSVRVFGRLRNTGFL